MDKPTIKVGSSPPGAKRRPPADASVALAAAALSNREEWVSMPMDGVTPQNLTRSTAIQIIKQLGIDLITRDGDVWVRIPKDLP